MAKVTGPLMSLDASGQVGKTIVFAKWKGQNYVRELVKPLNPEDPDQGDARMIFGGVGRAAGVVKPTSDYEAQMISLGKIPAGQSKQSALVKFMVDSYMTDATAFEAIYTAFEAHAEKAAFTASAATAGLIDLDIAYKGTTHEFSAGMMLYLLAKTAIAYGFTGSPYDTALASWTATETAELIADLAPTV